MKNSDKEVVKKYVSNVFNILDTPKKIAIEVNEDYIGFGTTRKAIKRQDCECNLELETAMLALFKTVTDHYQTMAPEHRYSKSITKFYIFADYQRNEILICNPRSTIARRTDCLIYPIFDLKSDVSF